MKISTSIVTKFTAFSVLLSLAAAPAFSAGPASSVSMKVGYFNLALVKASYPESAGSEALRLQAEGQLRRNVEEGNKRIQKMQDDKKPKEEIQEAAKQLQTEINAKQQALIELVQTQTQMANARIAGAAQQIAKEKNLDLVVDGAGIFAGGEKIINSGEDITDALVKQLSPVAASRPAEKAPAK